MENIRYEFVTRDGVCHPIDVSGACTIIDAVFEIASSLLNGDAIAEEKISPADIVEIRDIAG